MELSAMEISLSEGLPLAPSVFKRCFRRIQSSSSEECSTLLAEIVPALNTKFSEIELQRQLTAFLAAVAQHHPGVAWEALEGLNTFFEHSLQTELKDIDRVALSGSVPHHIVVALLRSMNYTLPVASLLEVFDHSITSVVAALISVLKKGVAGEEPLSEEETEVELALIAATVRLLHELTLPETHFIDCGEEHGDVPIAQLTHRYVMAVQEVCGMCMHFDALQVCVLATVPLLRRQASARAVHGLLSFGQNHHGVASNQCSGLLADRAHLVEMLRSLLKLLRNFLLFSSKPSDAARLRRYLSGSTTLATDVVAPYLWLLTDAASATRATSITAESKAGEVVGKAAARENISISCRDLGSQICLALEALVVLTFRVRSFRDFFRGRNITRQLLLVPWLRADVRILELLVRMNVNIDAVKHAEDYEDDEDDSDVSSKCAGEVPLRPPMHHVECGSSRSAHRLAEMFDRSHHRAAADDAEYTRKAMRAAICELTPASRQLLHRRLCDPAEDVALPIARQNTSCIQLAFAFDALHFEIENVGCDDISGDHCQDDVDVQGARRAAVTWLEQWVLDTDGHHCAAREAKEELSARKVGDDDEVTRQQCSALYNTSPTLPPVGDAVNLVQLNLHRRVMFVDVSRSPSSAAQSKSGRVLNDITGVDREKPEAIGDDDSAAKMAGRHILDPAISYGKVAGKEGKHTDDCLPAKMRPLSCEHKALPVQSPARSFLDGEHTVNAIKYRPHHISAIQGRPRLSPPRLMGPPHLLCALGGHVMVHPVQSPYGDVFDRATIVEHLERCGPRCPLDERRTLRLEDLLPGDAKLVMELKSYRFRCLTKRGLVS